MSWRNLITKNMLRNLRRYLGSLLAATLAVTIFAMFTAFVDNPAVQSGHVTQTARQLLIVFRVIVALFAIFFVFYFHAALIRARNQEFGLLLTLGVMPRQIGRLIFYESLLMGLVALIAGISLGIVCSYFFLLGMEAILAIPGSLPFSIPVTLFSVTGIFFGIVCLFEAGWISLRVTRRTPRVLLLGARIQQKPPRASWWLVLLGLACIGAAYDMALQFSSAILLTMIPIITLTISGTYLLFSQCSVMLLKRLRRPDIPGTRLLIVARLAHRIRDYARMLTVVTVLNAIVLTGMGAVFGVLNVEEAQQTLLAPFALQLLVNTGHPVALTPAQVQQEIENRHFQIQTIVDTPLVVGTISATGQSEPVSVISLSNFLYLQVAERQAHPEIAQNQSNATALSGAHAHLYIPFPDQAPAIQHLSLQAGSQTLALQVDIGDTRVLNLYRGLPTSARPPEYVVVLSDQLYAQVASRATPDQRWQVYSYVLPNWQKSTSVVFALRQRLPDDQQDLLIDAATANADNEQFLSVMLFAAFFISCLFFLAAGSTIYLKLFTQQEEDQRQFHALERIGMQRREVGRLLSREFLLLFFIPVALGIIHSGVALLDLVHLFNHAFAAIAIVAIGQAFAVICPAYVACFAVYFGIARVNYLRKMKLVSA